MFQCRKAKSGGKSADLVLTAGEKDLGVPRARLTQPVHRRKPSVQHRLRSETLYFVLSASARMRRARSTTG